MDVDIDRTTNRHSAFSVGPHRCLGSHLARRELIIAQEEWFNAIPMFKVQGGGDVPLRALSIIGAEKLPLEWTQD